MENQGNRGFQSVHKPERRIILPSTAQLKLEHGAQAEDFRIQAIPVALLGIAGPGPA
jgi:hypothetical protein